MLANARYARFAVTAVAIALGYACSGGADVPTPPAPNFAGAAAGSSSGATVKIRELDDLLGKNTHYNPLAVVYGPGGDLWIADNYDPDFGTSTIVRVSTSGKHVASYPTGSTYAGIAAGPDDALWIADTEGAINRLGTDGTYTRHPLKNWYYPNGITAGPDGALWFTATSSPRAYVGRMTTSGSVKAYAVTSHSWPVGIATGSDGNLWFTERDGGRIGRITPNGTVTEFSKGIRKSASPYLIAAGSDGALWFTESRGIGRITTSGEVTQYRKGISPHEHPFGIALGPDGAMWFTEYAYKPHHAPDRIGRIATDGTITEYDGIIPRSWPAGITAGPNGDLWFVEETTDLLGRIRF
jgi:virginiamycin B lyase